MSFIELLFDFVMKMRRFLYSQLLEYASGSQHTVIEPSSSGKLRVKPDVQFHLYISTAPCGDGALFSPRCTNCEAR